MAMLMCVATMGMLCACGDDNEELIVGKWKMTAQSDSENGGGVQPVTNKEEIWEFKADGTMVESVHRQDEVADYTTTETATYTVSGDKLTMRQSGMGNIVVELTIQKLDKKELVVNYTGPLFKGSSGEVEIVYYFERM